MSTSFDRRSFNRLFLGAAAVPFAEPSFYRIPGPGLPTPPAGERRNRTAIVLHRGCCDMAVENSLSALELAFLHGGDGVEIDIRATRDGTLVLLHDPWLDRTVDHYGSVDEYDYEVLLTYPFREPRRLTLPHERIPALRRAFSLCKDYNGLIHLDIKIPGVDGEILALVKRMELAENIVTVNPYNSDALRADPAIAPMPSLGSLIHGKNNYNGDAVLSLADGKRPGTLLVDDPRAAGTLFERPTQTRKRLRVRQDPPSCPHDLDTLWSIAESANADGRERRLALANIQLHYPRTGWREFFRRSIPLPRTVRADWIWALARLGRSNTFNPDCESYLIYFAQTETDDALLEPIAEACGEGRVQAGAVPIAGMLKERPPVRADGWDDTAAIARVRLRAAAFKALRRIWLRSGEITGLLRDGASNPGRHENPAYDALDAAEAVKSLAVLAPNECADLFRGIIEKTPENGEGEASGVRFRLIPECVHALGRIHGDNARKLLFEYLALSPDSAAGIHPSLQWDAARALCANHWRLDAKELETLLSHGNESVRREACRYLAEQADPAHRELRREHVPWFPI